MQYDLVVLFLLQYAVYLDLDLYEAWLSAKPLNIIMRCCIV